MAKFTVEMETAPFRWDTVRTLSDEEDAVQLAKDIVDVQKRAVKVTRLAEEIYIERPVTP